MSIHRRDSITGRTSLAGSHHVEIHRLCHPRRHAVPAGAAQAKDRIEADLILTNARIYTVEDKQPWAEAVAIKDGKIVAVGSTASVAKLRGAATRSEEHTSAL